MVEPDDGESVDPREAHRVEVRSGIEQETMDRIVRKVGASDREGDLAGLSDEHTAAFERQRPARVGCDVLEHGWRDSNGYSASTTIAMPIPPPMQSDATP
jgi:hypothetical protein